MRLTLQTLTGRKYYIGVTEHHKVRDIKKALFYNMEIKNKLRLLWKGQEIDDCNTLDTLGITEGETVSIVVEPGKMIKLYVKTFKKGLISVDVNECSTIPELRNVLFESGVGPSSQPHEFYFDSERLADNKIPIYMYGIDNGSTVVQKHTGSFKLKLIDGHNNEFVNFFTMRGSDTVQDLASRVLTIINAEYDLNKPLSEDDIVIFHQKKDVQKVLMYDELDCDTCTLSECNVEPLDIITFIWYKGGKDGTVKLLDFPVDLKVKGATHYKFPKIYGLANNESVHSLRLKVQHQLHIPYHRQIFSISGKSTLGNNSKIYREQFFKNLVCLEVMKK